MANSKKTRQADISALIACAIIGAVCFIADLIICAVFPDTATIVIGAIFLTVFIATSILISAFAYRNARNRAETESLISSEEDAFRDLVAQVDTAVYLTDGNGTLIWFNSTAAKLFRFSKKSIGADIYSVCSIREETLVEETKSGGISFQFKGREYEVTCF
ncbi:MAG: hypothetical protein J5894_01020, partial [Clostridia bacterium]|nr:hypothetical protein [Clostridia bacterium]